MKNLAFIGNLPGWGVALIALIMGALLIQQFRALRQHLSLSQCAILTLLRGSVYTLLILFLLSPVLVDERTTKLRRTLVLLVDTSQSMGFPVSHSGNDRRSRIDLVKERLLGGKAPLINRLARDYDLRLYEFNADLKPVGLGSLPLISAQGKGSRLFEALWKVTREARDAAGIIVLSDGIANGTERAQGLASFPLPVFTVGVGDTEGFKDLHIADLQAPDFAFRGRELSLDFTIKAYGLSGEKVPLYFNLGRNLITTSSVDIDRDVFEQRVTLSHTPREIGPKSFTLRLPLQEGEAIAHNNQKQFEIDVRRDKIRVLTLSGSPSWNYRFLRMALKQDPFIDLVSFVFLRTPLDTVDVPENQLSLIPFPIDEIFLEEIGNFDLVILDDFSHRSYFNTLYLEKIKDFVRDGGGLAMLGGARSFDSGGYGETPLEELLPVALEGKEDYAVDTSVRAVLTPAGKAHPITRIFPDPQANEEAWKGVPPLRSLNRAREARGEVLLSAAANGGGARWPLLIAGRFGTGRTLALMSDDFWRWNFIAVGEKESPQAHLKLIRQAARWLAREPSFEQVQIFSIAGTRTPGEKIVFRVRVLQDDFTPTSHASVQLRVVNPNGEIIPVEAVPEAEAGEYSAQFTPAAEGSYRIDAEAELPGKPLGRDRKTFLVALPYGEGEEARPRMETLKEIAEITKGEFVPASQWNEESWESTTAKLERLVPSRIVERRQIPLWSSLWTFGLILLLLGTEWWLRRTWGLV